MASMIKPFYEGKDQLIRDEGMCSSALAGMTLMLAAKGLGYDSCPVIGFDGEAVSKLINLSDNYALSFMILVGKQAKPAWDLDARLSNEIVLSMLFIKTSNRFLVMAGNATIEYDNQSNGDR